MIKWKQKSTVMTEHQTQRMVCDWLRLHGLIFFAVPNGSWLAGDERTRMILMAKLKAEGLRPGVSDLVIIDPPPYRPTRKGLMLELKTKTGKPTPSQLEWGELVKARGWEFVIGYGFDDTIERLTQLGYGVRHVSVDIPQRDGQGDDR